MSWSSDHLILLHLLLWKLDEPNDLEKLLWIYRCRDKQRRSVLLWFCNLQERAYLLQLRSEQLRQLWCEVPSGPHSQRICKNGTCSNFCNTRESRDCDGNSSNGCEINVEKIQKTVELVVWLATSRRTAIRRAPEAAFARCIVLRDSSFGITITTTLPAACRSRTWSAIAAAAAKPAPTLSTATPLARRGLAGWVAT